MKKFRAKIDTPWCKKGEIYVAHTYAFDRKTFSPKDIPFGYECVDHPEDYPDLFEPVEEKSDQEKWLEVLMGYYPYTKKGKDRDFKTLSANLVLLGYNPDKIYKEVCGEG